MHERASSIRKTFSLQCLLAQMLVRRHVLITYIKSQLYNRCHPHKTLRNKTLQRDLLNQFFSFDGMCTSHHSLISVRIIFILNYLLGIFLYGHRFENSIFLFPRIKFFIRTDGSYNQDTSFSSIHHPILLNTSCSGIFNVLFIYSMDSDSLHHWSFLCLVVSSPTS